MKLSHLFPLICVAFLGLSCNVWAFEVTPNAVPYYIEADSLPPQLLRAPPEEGSSAWRKQIDEVLKAQKNVSAVDLAAMKNEQHMRLDLITPVMGRDFTRERLPRTFALLDHVLADAAQVTEADKKFWHTRRPYLADKHVKLLIDPIDDSPAYPSGHTAEMRVLAEILGMLKPERLAELRARADAIAEHRVEAGVHYPNDLKGGRMLAMLIVGSLTASDDFQDDLTLARKEMAGK